MTEIETICTALQTHQVPAVLATLVKIEGSSYRRVGARMLWREAQPKIGGISGGCLEEDLLARCPEVARTGRAELISYDTSREEDLLWGVGLGCHGTAHILLESASANHPLLTVSQAWARHEDVIVATYIDPLPDGGLQSRCFLGSEIAKAGKPASDPLLQGAADVSRARRTDERAVNIAGASRRVLFEYCSEPVNLLICGAGDDAIPLASLALTLNWRVAVTDPRLVALTEGNRLPTGVTRMHCAESSIATVTLATLPSAAVVMSHHYRYDLPWVKRLLELEVPYVGLLGARKRAEKILADAANAGLEVSDAVRARLHAPVGLDLGGDGPELVALSVLAEIQAVLAGRNARPLRERQKGIHTPLD